MKAFTRGGILLRLHGFPWNRNPWLMTIISEEEKSTKNPTTTKTEAIQVHIWPLRILSCSQVIPGCARSLHCCFGFKSLTNGHASDKFSMKQERRMVEGGHGQKERSTMKTSVSLLKKTMKLCVMILSFSVHF